MLWRQTEPQVITRKKELRDEGPHPSQPTGPDGHSTHLKPGKTFLAELLPTLGKLDRHWSKHRPDAGFALLNMTASHQSQLWDVLPGKPCSVCRREEERWLQRQVFNPPGESTTSPGKLHCKALLQSPLGYTVTSLSP